MATSTGPSSTRLCPLCHALTHTHTHIYVAASHSTAHSPHDDPGTSTPTPCYNHPHGYTHQGRVEVTSAPLHVPGDEEEPQVCMEHPAVPALPCRATGSQLPAAPERTWQAAGTCAGAGAWHGRSSQGEALPAAAGLPAARHAARCSRPYGLLPHTLRPKCPPQTPAAHSAATAIVSPEARGPFCCHSLGFIANPIGTKAARGWPHCPLSALQQSLGMPRMRRPALIPSTFGCVLH